MFSVWLASFAMASNAKSKLLPDPSSLISPGDELVRRVSLYRRRHWLLHGHVAPFGALYLAWAYYWLLSPGAGAFEEHREPAFLSLAALGLLQVLLVLSCHWSVHVLAAMTCSRMKDPARAEVAKVEPMPNNGSPEIVKLHRDGEGDGGDTYLNFQKLKYTWDEERKVFRGVEFPTDRSYRYYLDYRGHETDEDLQGIKRHFGDNR